MIPFASTTTCACARPLSGRKLLQCYRTADRVPATKGATKMQRLQRDFLAMHRALMVEGQRKAKKVFAHYVKELPQQVCDAVEARLRHGRGKAVHGRKDVPYAGNGDDANDPLSIDVGAYEQVWASAIKEVLGDAVDVELAKDYKPVAQSVAAKAYERAAMLLNEKISDNASAMTMQRTEELCRLVTRINETTREVMAKTIKDAMANGDGSMAVLREVRAKMLDVAANRLPTIVRTEVGRALEAGKKQALSTSKNLKTVKVIGCTSVEPNGQWKYHGRPTCNITGVPARDADQLEWHPNHTGCLVPESWAGDSGYSMFDLEAEYHGGGS